MGDDAWSAGGHDDRTGRVRHRYRDAAPWTDQTSSNGEGTTDPCIAPPPPTSAAVAAASPITWRAAPLPTSESAAAVAADSPITWRAAPLPATESAAAPSDEQASDEQAPGAADGIAAPSAPPERTSPSAPAQRGGGTRNAKRSGLVFYGFVAVLLAVDVIGAGLANTSDASKASTHLGASATAPVTFATTLSTTTTTPADTFPMGTKVAHGDGSSVQVYSYEQPVQSENRFLTAPAGSEYGVADVEVCAGSSTPASYNPLGFSAQTPDDRVHEATIGARYPSFGSGDIPAGGGCVRGWVTFAVPTGPPASWIVWKYPGWSQATWTS